MNDSFLPTVTGRTFQIRGSWVIEDGERGAALLAEVARRLGAGNLTEQSREGSHRDWKVVWRSAEGACLRLAIHPYFSDAQSYDYVLELPANTAIRIDLVDACTMSTFEVTVREGSLPFVQIEAEVRQVFAAF